MILIAAIVMIVVLVANSARGVRDDSPVYAVLNVEAGEPFDPSAFLKDRRQTIEVSQGSFYNVNVPGDYALELIVDGEQTVHATLKVRDTLPPEYTVLPPLIVKRGSDLKAEMLMPQEFIADATPVKVSFISNAVSTSREGPYTALLRLIDGGGNITKASCSYFVRDSYNNDYYYEIGDRAPEPDDLFPGASIEKWESLNFTPVIPSRVTVYLTMHDREYFVRYEAKDTVPPAVVIRDEQFVLEAGSAMPDPMTFIDRIIDNTATTVTYDQEYVLDRAERKRINLLVTDLGGNVTSAGVTVSVVARDGEDTAPPIISGVKDLTTEPGVRPNYLDGVSVYDARDGVIPTESIRIDDSRVNYNVPSSGVGYEVIYSVSDKAGNTASVTAYVKIVQNILPDSELDRFFDGVIAEMGALDGLKPVTILGRVYTLLTRNYLLIPGSAHTNLSDLRKEAYWGFRMKSGDSETACAMLSVILDRLGIDHIKVERSAKGAGKHSFMLVDYGFGWLFMDTMPTGSYVWTTDGRLLRTDSAEAKALGEEDVLRREELTKQDLDRLNDLSNSVTVGWNYYRIDDKDLPECAIREADGTYRSPSYSVNYQVNNVRYGSISGQASQSVVHGGNTAEVTAVAAKGYKFVSWSDGVTSASRSDRVTRELQLEARFAPDSQTFTYYEVRYEAGEGGRIDGSDVQSVLYGDSTTTVTARPDDRHYFDKWSDGVGAPSRQDVVTGKATYQALFLPKKVLHYIAAEGGSIEGRAEQYLNPGSYGAVVRAVPDKGYIFAGWSDGAVSPERRDRGDEDAELTALFERDTSLYTVTYTAGEGGSIEGETEQTVVCFGTTVTVTARADEGWTFVGWSDGVTSESRSDEVLENRTYEALFEAIAVRAFTVTYLGADGGTVLGETVQTVGEGNFTETVRAEANEGFAFAGWSDGYAEAERSDAATGDVVYIALFVPLEENGGNGE